MSSQDGISDNNSFTQILLRPWSFASLDDADTSTSTHVSAVEETWSLSEETWSLSEGTYTQAHRRRKSLGAWAQYSSSARENPSSEEQFAVGEGGWWNQQMLVDRSLRSMAALMTFFAIVMLALCCAYIPNFRIRSNLHSTSVEFKNPGSCGSTEKTNVVCVSSNSSSLFRPFARNSTFMAKTDFKSKYRSLTLSSI